MMFRTLMDRQITPVTEHYRVRVFSLSIIAYGAFRVFRRQLLLRLRYSLRLYRHDQLLVNGRTSG